VVAAGFQHLLLLQLLHLHCFEALEPSTYRQGGFDCFDQKILLEVPSSYRKRDLHNTCVST
jgi:hypothetical protein